MIGKSIELLHCLTQVHPNAIQVALGCVICISAKIKIVIINQAKVCRPASSLRRSCYASITSLIIFL